jgi:hypothetical protein
MRRTFIAILLLAAATGMSADTDQLSFARRRLHPAQCGNYPGVAAVASVYPDPHQVYLSDWVVISVCHLDQLVKAAEAEQAPITLFVEGIDSGNEATGIDLESGTLTFELARNAKNQTLWRPFLYDPLFDPEADIRLSVGIRGERAIPRVPGANMTVRLRKIWIDWVTWIWLGVLVLIMVAIILCAIYTDMLRDGTAGRRFSLGRTQMAWWFFLVVLSYVFIWLVTGDRDTVPPSLLGLMGISAATALASAAIPTRNDNPIPSRGLWLDLVADDKGVVALDRLQVVVWTIVLGGVFLNSVFWDLTMPEFNATLLALMGISSGTYIGFKLPNVAPPPPAAPAR